MNKQYEVFLKLIRLGIGTEMPGRLTLEDQLHNKDWEELMELAERNGLSAIMLDGLERAPENLRPPKPVLLQWIGKTLQGFEYRHELYRRAIAEMAAFYNSNGFKMMVLKGFACSINWPKPEHRPCGDIDIWLFGQQKEADAALTKERDIIVDNSHHHHTVFCWRDFMVENHYDFINVHHRKSNVGLEKALKQLGEDDSHYVEVYGENVYLPSPNLHTLFILKHTMNDFAAVSITFRQLLDWAFHVQKHTKEIDWEWLTGVMKQYHMMDFFNCINAICVEELCFPSSIFPFMQFNPKEKERVLNDILFPKYLRDEPKGLVRRLVYKYHRWQGNAWKQELCYQESRWSAFWSGLWSHLLKPRTI